MHPVLIMVNDTTPIVHMYIYRCACCPGTQ